MTLNENKNGMDTFTYPPSLTFLSRRRGEEGPGEVWGGYRRVQQSRPNLKHRFAAQGVFRLDTQGAGTPLHRYTLLHQTFHLALLALGDPQCYKGSH